MCRMIGIVSRGPVYYDLFEEFADLAVKGMGPLGAPDERGHRDGWGLVCFQDGELKFHERDGGAAPESSKYYGASWRIAKLNIERAASRSLIVLGHLRRASDRARMGAQWSQPFVETRSGVTWSFSHNGSIVRGDIDANRSDSQVLFALLLDALDGREHADVARATRAVRRRVIDDYGGFTGLNFLLTDGRNLHVYRDFQANGDYYSLYQDDLGELIVAASEPVLGMADHPIPRGILQTVGTDLVVQREAIA